jgi:hypothetical protein
MPLLIKGGYIKTISGQDLAKGDIFVEGGKIAAIGGKVNAPARCLRDGDDMPEKYPEVYWWIYKKDYDNYIRNWVGEFGLGFRDFTLVCDDDRKLDKFIPVLEKHLMTFMVDE